MRQRLIFWTVGLVIVLTFSACVPATTPVSPAPTPAALSATVQVIETATQTVVPTEAPTLTVQPLATSRGPNLEATDPTTVALASGGLQLVEFFRFT